jgi:hypothetical protein
MVNPFDATKHTPVIMTTNENPYQFMKGTVTNRGVPTHNQDQLDAVKRRVTIVPFKDKFADVHSLDSAH